MNLGKYVFSQVIDFIPRYQFDKLVKKYNGDWHSKELTCYNQLLHLLFGQIAGCDSLRDICMCLDAHKAILYHLGIRNSVTHSSLSRANETRDYRIFEELGQYLICIVRPLYSSTKLDEITNVVVKTLWGYSENAVRTHLWTAIIAYLIIARIKAEYESPYSATEIATLIRISALERVDLRNLITKPKDSTIQNQNVNERSLFDNV